MNQPPTQQEIEALFRNPLWYREVIPLFQAFETQAREWPVKKVQEEKDQFYSHIERLLETKAIPLGNTGPDWDSERQPIDTVVIHHTHHQPGISWQRLNAIHLIRLYAQSYYSQQRSSPIYSHHVRDGHQVFYAYHWLVRMDGSAERLLNDTEIGWHAGNWATNCRSVAICLDNTYDDSQPTPEVLSSVAGLIHEWYPLVKRDRVLGHCEINQKTTCPGSTFIPSWKTSLIDQLPND